VVRQFALDELVAESDIKRFARSASSIWWRDEYRIDSAAGQLVSLISSADEYLPSQWARTGEVRIDLATDKAHTSTLRQASQTSTAAVADARAGGTDG
jgi:hypothetical protein